MSRKAKPAGTLFTIGYQQATPDAVLDELARAGVAVVIDTRAVAASRKPGFSKRQLAAGLDARSIGYVHLQGLGTPKEGRLAARSGNMDRLFAIYRAHLGTRTAREEMDGLEAIVRAGRPVCLLCFERDPKACHRQWIAEAIEQRTGVRVAHLAARLPADLPIPPEAPPRGRAAPRRRTPAR